METRRQTRALPQASSDDSWDSSDVETEKCFSVHPHVEDRSCLPLPVPFCRAHSHQIEDFVILLFTNKDHWKLKVDRKVMCCYDHLYFTRGWKLICDSYGLFSRPHVVDIEFDGWSGQMAAVIKVLDATGQIPINAPFLYPDDGPTRYCFLIPPKATEAERVAEAVPDDGFNYFSKTLTPQYASKMYVPVDFFNQYVLERKEVGMVFEGRPGQMKGIVVKRQGERGCDLTGEWSSFTKHHAMRCGVTYCFKTDGQVHEGLPLVIVMEH